MLLVKTNGAKYFGVWLCCSFFFFLNCPKNRWNRAGILRVVLHVALYIVHLAPVTKKFLFVSFLDKILSSQVSFSFFLMSKEDKNIVQV